MSFEFMLMILKIHMFKVDLSKNFKTVKMFFKNFFGCPKKQNKLQIDEIFDFLTFLVDDN